MKIIIGEKEANQFDWALRMARSPGDEIVVEAGATVFTQGSWAFPEFQWIGLAPGVRLSLGKGSTVLLAANAVRTTDGLIRPNRDLNILWIGADAEIVGEGTLDANYEAHPGWNCGGIRAFGKCQLSGLTIIGLSGDRQVKESFAFSAEGATGGTHIVNVKVNRCSIGPGSYVSGIYVGATIDNGIRSIVELCEVDLGEHGHFAYSSTFITFFLNCVGKSMRFWYTDTGDGIAVIEQCSGGASYSVIGSVATESQVSRPHTRSVVVEDSEFTQIGKEARWIEWWNKGGVQLGGVVIKSCTFNGFTHRAAIVGTTGSVVLIETEWNPVDGGVTEYPKDAIEQGSFAPIEIP